MPKIEIFYQIKQPWLLPYSKLELEQLLTYLCNLLEKQGFSFSSCLALYIVDDAIIASVNERCLACRGATNILTLPNKDPVPSVLVLSLDTLLRECLLYGQAVSKHCQTLLIHALAHVVGLDHGAKMQALENFLATNLQKSSILLS